VLTPSRVADRTGSELTWLIVAKVNSLPPAPIAGTGMLSLWPATRVAISSPSWSMDR